jgi:hypothetical protein
MTSPETAESDQFFAEMHAQIESTSLPTGRRFGRGVRRPDALTGGRPAVLHRRSSLVGLGVGVAGVASVLALALNAAGNPQSASAATLDTQAQTVTITLQDTQAIGALNAKLSALGVQITVVPAVAGCSAPVQTASNDGQPTPGAPQTLDAAAVGGSAQLPAQVVTMTLATNDIPAGDTEVVAETSNGLDIINAVVVGQAPACVGITPGYPSASSSS